MALTDWMTEEDKKIAGKWETAKKYKPGGAMATLIAFCVVLGIVTAVFVYNGSFPAWLIIVDVILAVALIVWIALLISRYKTYRQMEFLPEVKAYEARWKAAIQAQRERWEAEARAERARKEAAREARVAPLKRGHEKHELIVCASATYDGHYDRDGTRQVYVDGVPYGQANPWVVLGLPSGHHSVYVVYTERVGGNVYRMQTDAVSVCADEESVVLYTCKNGTTVYPNKVRGISSLGEVIEQAESDGAPAPNF